jgi:hypothetical protein
MLLICSELAKGAVVRISNEDKFMLRAAQRARGMLKLEP